MRQIYFLKLSARKYLKMKKNRLFLKYTLPCMFVIIIVSVYIYLKPKLGSSLKKCIQKSGEQYFRDTEMFFRGFSKCIQNHVEINLTNMDKFENGYFGEKKVFIPLKVDNFQRECVWLTIGVGGTTEAETLIHKKYPQCRFFGVEPEKVGNFSSIGNVIPFAIGLTDVVNGSVETETKNAKMLNVISLTNVLDNYVNSRFIYYLTIDIEGYEYIILESLVGNGKFVNEGITFCQIDAELHNIKMETIHPDVKDLNPVEFILNFLQDSSPYIPIFNEPYTFHPHQKVTFINIVDPRCEKAFSFSTFFK